MVGFGREKRRKGTVAVCIGEKYIMCGINDNFWNYWVLRCCVGVLTIVRGFGVPKLLIKSSQSTRVGTLLSESGQVKRDLNFLNNFKFLFQIRFVLVPTELSFGFFACCNKANGKKAGEVAWLLCYANGLMPGGLIGGNCMPVN